VSKDVVYVDAEDDITDIIGKVKASKEKIVAIVPPKRVGALQSAVNLKLLAKSAKADDKAVVLITGNRAIEPLAAVAKIPIARTLQTKPEIPTVAALEDETGEIDVIEGEKVPASVGELDDAAKTVKADAPSDDMNDQILSGIDLDDQDDDSDDDKSKKSKKGKGKSAIPNFDKFRKKLFVVVAAVLALTGLMIWAFVFAPKATITIKTKIAKQNISEAVTLTTEQVKTDAKKGVLLAKKQQVTKKAEVEFVATGEKYVGAKATGRLEINNCDSTSSFTIPVGTEFSANGYAFVSTAAATVSGFSGSHSACRNSGAGAGTGTVQVQAADIGDEYNLQNGLQYSTGMPDVYAYGSAMTGGEKHKAKVVNQGDIDKAREGLKSANETEIKRELTSLLTGDFIFIESSLKAEAKDAVSVPALDQEIKDGAKAKLTVETVYTVYGADRSQIKEFLVAKANDNLDSKDEQKVYTEGASGAYLTQFVDADGGLTARLRATAEIGPKIDEQYVRDVSKGKRYGEVQGELESISGVESVDVKFSFFWVATVPNNDAKITVKFESK
jgi:hypothetical protein